MFAGSLKLSLDLPKSLTPFQVLKWFLLILEVTCIIFARTTNTDVEGYRSARYYKMHLSSASPRGGPRADVGECGDFMGTLQQFSALVVGGTWGLRFLNALLSGRMWGLRFCSTERRLGTIDCSEASEQPFRVLRKLCV